MAPACVQEITKHPVSSRAEQVKFIKQLDSLLTLVEEEKIINPFRENSKNLITLDTGEMMDPEVTKCLAMIEETGETLMREYVTSKIEKAEKPISDTIIQ